MRHSAAGAPDTIIRQLLTLQAKQIKHHNGLFLIACARGLLSEAQQLLDMGAQPGTQDKGGLSGAHFAAAHGKQDVLSFLWSKGVELDGEDPGESSETVCGRTCCDAAEQDTSACVADSAPSSSACTALRNV